MRPPLIPCWSKRSRAGPGMDCYIWAPIKSGPLCLQCCHTDWADMCKHVAAALYGVGARLDERPQLLFKLRGVDENELLANAGRDLALTKAPPAAANILDNSDVAALFGLEMAEPAIPDAPVPAAPKLHPRSGRSRATDTTGGSNTQVVKKTAPKKKNDRRAGRTPSKTKKASRVDAAKGETRPIDATQPKIRSIGSARSAATHNTKKSFQSM